MTRIKDLEICDYFPVRSEKLVAVGWLSWEFEFPKGKVSGEFYSKLKNLASKPFQTFVSGGAHECELCQFDGAKGTANLFIPYDGNVYAAPELIVHYVAVHNYLPPEIFIKAVLECPQMQSIEYKKKLLSHGGRDLLKKETF